MIQPDLQLIPSPGGAEASAALARLLHALPEWFGQPAATAAYIERARHLPGWLAMPVSGEVACGALFLEKLESAFEIHVMAVDPARHRCGIGRALVAAAQGQAAAASVPLQVKTLSARHPDPFYARTRQFYLACGFVPLAELDVWGPANPCLLMEWRG